MQCGHGGASAVSKKTIWGRLCAVAACGFFGKLGNPSEISSCGKTLFESEAFLELGCEFLRRRVIAGLASTIFSACDHAAGGVRVSITAFRGNRRLRGIFVSSNGPECDNHGVVMLSGSVLADSAVT